MSFRVLVVDDDDCLRDVIANYLKMQGHDVETANDGEAGYDAFALAESPFDVIVSDVHMPKLDGFEMREMIRAHCREREMKAPHVILMSALDPHADLIKPFPLPHLDFALKMFERIREAENILERKCA